MTRFDQAAAGPDAAEILRSIGDVAYHWQLDTDALSWTDNAADVLGIDVADVATGRSYARVASAEGGQSRIDAIMQSSQRDDGAGVAYQIQYAIKCGEAAVWVEDTGRWFAGTDGRPQRAHGLVRRIDERHEAERRLTQLAKFDPLTGELNRPYLTEVLTATVDEVVRFRESCGFLLIAIDSLGRLNEAYGFDVTEEVIAQVAKRIRARLRGKDHLGRFSGNKFGAILTRCSPDEMAVAAERLLAGVRDEPIITAAGPVAVTVTIGGVNVPRHARTVAEVVSRALDALHAARSKRLGSFAAYRPNVELDAMRRESARTTDEIVSALNGRRIALAFEPVVDAGSRRVAFYECLMRVYRADGGIAHANEIVPIAEKVGLVRMLDYRVLELVVAELAEAPVLCASVNVSPASTVDPDWYNGLAGLLRTYQNVAERLTIEITETAAIQNIDDARGFVTRVKDLGCRIAIDDFGAGHTSFRNLRKLGVDVVKIDGAFVQNLVKSSDDRAFVHTLIDLSQRLGLKTVAEWVQDEEAARLLTGFGCDYLQGRLIGLADIDRPWLRKPSNAVGA